MAPPPRTGRLQPPRLAAGLTRRVVTELPPPDEGWAGVELSGQLDRQLASGLDVAGSVLRTLRLAGVDVDRLLMTDTRLEGCDLSGARFGEATLTRVEFRDCRLSRVVLAGAHLRDVRFTDCKLDDADFRMARGDPVEFSGSDLRAADFGSAHLTGGRLLDCDLTGAEFGGADLTGARLHGSTLAGIKGAASLRAVVVDSTQVIPLAERLFAALGIRIDDERSAAGSA